MPPSAVLAELQSPRSNPFADTVHDATVCEAICDQTFFFQVLDFLEKLIPGPRIHIFKTTFKIQGFLCAFSEKNPF